MKLGADLARSSLPTARVTPRTWGAPERLATIPQGPGSSLSESCWSEQHANVAVWISLPTCPAHIAATSRGPSKTQWRPTCRASPAHLASRRGLEVLVLLRLAKTHTQCAPHGLKLLIPPTTDRPSASADALSEAETKSKDPQRNDTEFARA